MIIISGTTYIHKALCNVCLLKVLSQSQLIVEAVQRMINVIPQIPVMERICNKGRDDCVVANAPKVPPGFVETEI